MTASSFISVTNETRLVLSTSVVLVGSAYVLIKWFKQKSYFKTLNIPSGPTPYPIIGNTFQLLKLGLLYFDLMILKNCGTKENIVGYFEGNKPIIVCANPKLIKSALIKDFNCFVNKRVLDMFICEPFDKFLTVLKDEEWKNVRSIVTKTFTIGKLKEMSKLMINCSDIFMKHIDDLAAKAETFDAKKVFNYYTVDVIASCCFGVQTDALNDPENEFMKHIKKLAEPEINIKTALMFFMPRFARYVSQKGWIDIFPHESLEYIAEVTKEIIQRRKSKEEFREDFIQIMINHDENSQDKEKEEKVAINETSNESPSESVHGNFQWKPLKKSLTAKEILSQSILFLIAGYETTATTLQFVSYNLALNLACQDKLCEEIDAAFEKHGSLSYDMVNDIPYLDMVIYETLRMFPAAMRFDRVANSDYKYEDMSFPKGSILVVDVYAIHNNPEYYPEPEKFIPERFTPELRRERESEGVFLPFGLGPRNCIGMKFAMIEMKIALCSILSKYHIQTCEQTPMEIKFGKLELAKSLEPIILQLSKRKNQ